MAGKVAYVYRKGSILLPTSREQQDILHTIPNGRWVKGTFVQERKVERNAAFHALCGDLAKALRAAGQDDATLDNVKMRLLLAIGHSEIYELPRAIQHKVGVRYAVKARSVSFAEVDEIEFREILDRVTRFVITDLLPFLPYGELVRQMEYRLQQHGLPPLREVA